MYEESKSFLGTGWSFPPAFNEENYGIEVVSEEEDIRQSLHLLLSTSPGERLMNPDYGCDLQRMVFDSIDASTISEIKDLIGTAILYFEPRVTLEDIIVDIKRETEGLMDITLIFTIRKINVRSNIVYPFYFIEGTNIREVA